MYSADGVYYTEEYSVSFGDLYVPSGQSNTEFKTVANTWDDWHLIPSSKPSIAAPGVVTKFIEIPGADGMLDLSDYLTGRPTYGQRQGSIAFYSANRGDVNEVVHEDMMRILHGKKLKMRLMSDPAYYYEGRFSVGALESGASYSGVTISYQLDPYKIRISEESFDPVIWDTFNFETDYDYSVLITDGVTEGRYYIYGGEYPFAPVATYVSGSGTISFGYPPIPISIDSPGTYTLGVGNSGRNILIVTGSLKVNISWRGGSL